MSILIGLVLAPAWAAPPPIEERFPRDCLRNRYRAGRPHFVGSAKSSNFPIKVHWDRQSDQQKAMLWLDWLELSWQVQVNELGFLEPQLPDTEEGPELDVYLTATGVNEWSAFASPDNYQDNVGGDGYMGTSAYLVAHRDITEDWIASYAAHEFNHVLQWGMDFTEPSYPIWEATATAHTTWTYGYEERGRWYASVRAFQALPQAPTLIGYGGDLEGWYPGYEVGYYEYGAALWVRHIDELLLDNRGKAGAELWHETAQQGQTLEPDVVDSVQTVSGMDLGEFMNSMALSRWLVGEEWDERGLVDAEDWDANRKVPAFEYKGSDIPLEGLVPDFDGVPPMPTGQVFVQIDPDGAADESITLSASSGDGLHSAIAVFTWAADGTTEELGDWGGRPVVTVDLQGLDNIVVVFSNLGPPNFDPDEDRNYPYGDQEWRIDLGETPKGGGGGDCGCQTGPSGVSAWLSLVALVGLRRRHQMSRA